MFPACWFGGEFGHALFAYVFAAYLILDSMMVKLDTLYQVHHVGCLIGHSIIMMHIPQTFSTYFAGVVTLELGSGTMNHYLMWPNRPGGAALYAIAMTVSNACGLAITWQYLQHEIGLVPKLLNAAITLIMIFLRQKSCFRYIARGGYH